MTRSRERIQQLLTDKDTLTKENIRLKNFAEAAFKKYQAKESDGWPGCPFCGGNLALKGVHGCEYAVYAASRGDE